MDQSALKKCKFIFNMTCKFDIHGEEITSIGVLVRP